jgi:signal transduction histidine kinase
MVRLAGIGILIAIAFLRPGVSRATWDALGLEERVVVDLALSGDRLYACTDTGVYRKDLSEPASPWVPIGLQTRRSRALLVVSSDTLVASLRTSPSDTISLYRTTDAGATWHAYQNGFGSGWRNPEAAALIRLPHQLTTWIAVGSSIEKSVNGGASWQWRADGCVFNFVEANPYATSQVWAGGESCIFWPVLFKSVDSGDTWELFQLDAGGDNACDAVAFDPLDPDVVYVGMEGRIMRTIDGGAKWETIPTPDPSLYSVNVGICCEALGDHFELATASTGTEGISTALRFCPDVILLDIMMPDPHMRFSKIVLVTARSQIVDRLRGYDAGADDYITKPFDPDELLAKVNVFVRLKSVEELDRLKSDMLHLVSHETRTPLTGIMGSLEILRDDDSVTAESREWIDLAMNNCERLRTLVEKANLLCDLRTGNVSLKQEFLSMNELVNQAVENVHAASVEREVTIDMRRAHDLLVAGDRSHLGMVLHALLDNAVRFNSSSGTVTVEVSEREDWATVVVTDSGPGIEAAYLPHVFEGFVSQNVDNHAEGHGLSLALSREIVRAHAGMIDVESSPEHGTRFTLQLPIRRSTVSVEDSAAERTRVTSL